MKACFNDFITIRALGTSKSGLYIDDVAGLPADLINKMRTPDNNSLSDFWDKFYARSVETFTSEVGNKVSEKFYNNEVVESRESGEFKDELNTTSETYAGVSLDFPESRYVENQILTISFKADSTASPLPKIYFFDKLGGTLLSTYQLTEVNEGLNIVNYYGTFDVDKLFIAYKPAELTLYKTGVYDRYYDNQDTFTSINQVNEGGIIVEINNYCSLEKFVCTRLFALKNAFRDHLAMELMKERVLTNNINKYTTLTEEKANELAGYYMNAFEKSMTSAFKHVRINDDKLCMQCRGTVARKIIVP